MPVNLSQIKQSTLLNEVLEDSAFSSNLDNGLPPRLIGVGLHTGKRYGISLEPKTIGDGDTVDKDFENRLNEFRLHIASDEFSSPAYWSRLSGTSRSTALVMRSLTQRRRLELKTVEHFLAASSVCAINALYIHVDVMEPLDENCGAYEMPVFDGSSKLWLEYLQQYLSSHIYVPLKYAWRVVKDYEVKDKERIVSIKARRDFKSSWVANVRFGEHWTQEAEYLWDYENLQNSVSEFANNIAPARTFGFKEEVESLRARGLIKGGSMENAVLIDGHRVVNPEGMRLVNELAAHKLLDGLGDFALLGAPIIADVRLEYAGHEMHLRAVEEGVRRGYLERITL